MPDPAPRRLATLTDPEAIRAAIRQFDEAGGIDGFLAAYPDLELEPSLRFFIVENGRHYDAAPICAVAFGIQHPHLGPLSHSELAGANAGLARFLRRLGFTVVPAPPAARAQRLASTREETILIADLYVNVLDRRRPGPNHPAVVALSACLRRAPWHHHHRRLPGFRSPETIVALLGRMARVDPDRDPLPRHLQVAHGLDREILNEFRFRYADLAAEAARLREHLALPGPDIAPEVAAALADTARSAGRPEPDVRPIDVASRRALRAEAIRHAVAWLESHGWSHEDVSATLPCDLLATRGGKAIHVVVKGTAGAGADILLTHDEVAHARKRYPDTALFVTHSLRLVHDPSGAIEAVRGESFVVRPWRPTDESLTATGWSHAINPTLATNLESIPPASRVHRAAPPSPHDA